jgi:hypothetical protein
MGHASDRVTGDMCQDSMRPRLNMSFKPIFYDTDGDLIESLGYSRASSMFIALRQLRVYNLSASAGKLHSLARCPHA